MKSLIELITGASQLLLSTVESSPKLIAGTPVGCPADPPLSCHVPNTFKAVNDDSCCVNYPGGQFAATQFWNSNPRRGVPGYLGPNTSWTIHGLWPDHCSGTYDSVCDCERSGDCSSRNRKCSQDQCNRDYSNIENIFKNFEEYELLDYVSQYWKGNTGDESLHQHEWSKHGTCINTIRPSCYQNYVTTQEVVDYFRVAVDLFKSLPTYKWLEEAGITPSNTKVYQRDDIRAALRAPRGVTPILGCEGRELREVWYFFESRGSAAAAANFEPSEPNFSGAPGGLPGKFCPPRIRYLPKA